MTAAESVEVPMRAAAGSSCGSQDVGNRDREPLSPAHGPTTGAPRVHRVRRTTNPPPERIGSSMAPLTRRVSTSTAASLSIRSRTMSAL